MSTYLCPKGHHSIESDYCSECGVRIQAHTESLLSNVPLPSTQSKGGQLTCPDCSALHEPDSGDFCEICGHNFVTGARGELPIAVSHPPVLEPITQADEPQTQKQGTLESGSSTVPSLPSPPLSWELTITIDPIAHDPASPPPPDTFAPFSLPLEPRQYLIGRTSQARAIHPEISLDLDDAVSHRHALLSLNADGTLTLRDIGSANGTRLNDIELKPMVDVPLKQNDEITLGHWTKIKVIGH